MEIWGYCEGCGKPYGIRRVGGYAIFVNKCSCFYSWQQTWAEPEMYHWRKWHPWRFWQKVKLARRNRMLKDVLHWD